MISIRRYDYIDIAKGLGILLVVWAHILLTGMSHRLIYAFHMPLFFFLSGLLFNKDKYPSFKQFFKARFKRLLVPYFMYSVVTWAIWALFRYLHGDEVKSFSTPLVQTFIAQGSGAYMVHNSALWFIPCLLAVEIMYYFIGKMKGLLPLLASMAVAIAGVILANLFGARYLFLLPWNLDAAFYGILFYAVAVFLKQKVGHEKYLDLVANHTSLSLFVSASLFLILWILSSAFGECSMGSSSYQCPEYIFFIRAFVGIALTLVVSALLSAADKDGKVMRPLKWCGKNSLGIMCIHIPIKGIAIIITTKLLHPIMAVSENGWLSMLAFVMTILVIIPFVNIVNIKLRAK